MRSGQAFTEHSTPEKSTFFKPEFPTWSPIKPIGSTIGPLCAGLAAVFMMANLTGFWTMFRLLFDLSLACSGWVLMDHCFLLQIPS